MLNQGYSKEFSGFHNSPCKNQISVRWRRIIGQMIVAQDNTAGIGQDGRLKDFSAGADCHIHDADGSAVEIDDVIAVIKIEYQDALCRQIFRVPFQEVQDRIRIGKPGVVWMTIRLLQTDTRFDFRDIADRHNMCSFPYE